MRAWRRMTPLLVLGLIGALLGVARAEEGQGIIVRSEGTGYVDVTIQESQTITLDEVIVTTKGRFGGFLLQPDTSTRPFVGLAALPFVGAGGSGNGSYQYVYLSDTLDVFAGRYRLYVLGEGPVEVFIPLTGQALRGYHTVRSARVDYRPFKYSLRAGQQSVERRQRFYANRYALVLAAQRTTSGALTGTDFVHTCVTRASTKCPSSPTTGLRAPGVATRTSAPGIEARGWYDTSYSVSRGYGMHEDTNVNAIAMMLLLDR